MNLSPRKQVFVDKASEMFGAGAILSKTSNQGSRCCGILVYLHHLGFVNLVR